MKEKKRTEEIKGNGGGDSILDGAPDLTESKNATISSGVYVETLPVAGMTVGEVRRRFSDRFDITDQAKAVINGTDVGDEAIIQSGETLMFIHHAGEKGAAKVTIEGEQATVHTPEGETCSIPVATLLEHCAPGYSTGGVLPDGVKAVISQGPLTLWFWERPPCIQKLSWIRSDSPVPFGPGTKYRDVRIALPYLVLMAVFWRDEQGLPRLLKQDECFFRTRQLASLDDDLFYPGLLNCSKWANNDGDHPLSWICTQYLKKNPDMDSDVPMDRFRGGMEAVRYCLLETSFNLSSEHHEGNSWYGASKKVIPKIATVEKWEEETKNDPLFVLDLKWIPTKRTLNTLAERTFQRLGQNQGLPTKAEDLARIIQNQS